MHGRVKIIGQREKPVRGRLRRAVPRLYEWAQVAAWLVRDRRDRLFGGDRMARVNAALTEPTHIEIETFNRCNSACSFCPVNRDDDPRALRRMDESLFRRIVAELSEAGYRHKLCLHSNNEPFLDKRIFELTAYARRALPQAFLQIYTNGTVLDAEKTDRILPHLSSLVINNYATERELHANVAAIVRHIEANRPELAERVVVRYRLLDELKTNRSGEAPNRRVRRPVYRSACAYPYFQMVIRPDGKVSMCCYDALGDVTLGDVAADGVFGAWRSAERQAARTAMLDGRDALDKCRHCDNLAWSKPARLTAALASPDARATYMTSLED